MRKAGGRIQDGFTLAEILAVIAVIGVLVGVAIPVFQTQREKAREASDIAYLRQAQAAAAVYFAAHPPTSQRVSRKYYNAQTGQMVSWVSETAVKAIPLYGKGTSAKGLGLWTEEGIKYHENLDVRDCLIMAVCDRDKNICCGWVKPKYAIRADPFTFLAVNSNGTLYPTRSAAHHNSQDAPSLYVLDSDLNTFVNQTENAEEMKNLQYTLEMYYSKDMEVLNLHDVVQQNTNNDSLMALRVELFYCMRVYSLTTPQNNYFENTIFQTQLCDAEAVTLATQYSGRDVDQFKADNFVDETTGATQDVIGWDQNNS